MWGTPASAKRLLRVGKLTTLLPPVEITQLIDPAVFEIPVFS